MHNVLSVQTSQKLKFCAVINFETCFIKANIDNTDKFSIIIIFLI